MNKEDKKIEQMQQRVFFKQVTELSASALEKAWPDDNKAIYIANLLQAIADVFGPEDFTREQIQMVNGAYNIVREVCDGGFNLDRLHQYITPDNFSRYVAGIDPEPVYTPNEGYRGSNNDPF